GPEAGAATPSGDRLSVVGWLMRSPVQASTQAMRRRHRGSRRARFGRSRCVLNDRQTACAVSAGVRLTLAELGSQGGGLEACQCVTALLNGCSGRDAGWRMEVVARRDSRQPL